MNYKELQQCCSLLYNKDLASNRIQLPLKNHSQTHLGSIV